LDKSEILQEITGNAVWDLNSGGTGSCDGGLSWTKDGTYADRVQLVDSCLVDVWFEYSLDVDIEAAAAIEGHLEEWEVDEFSTTVGLYLYGDVDIVLCDDDIVNIDDSIEVSCTVQVGQSAENPAEIAASYNRDWDNALHLSGENLYLRINYDDEWYEIGEGESLDFSAEWDM
jgi:hypothetical protein